MYPDWAYLFELFRSYSIVQAVDIVIAPVHRNALLASIVAATPIGTSFQLAGGVA